MTYIPAKRTDLLTLSSTEISNLVAQMEIQGITHEQVNHLARSPSLMREVASLVEQSFRRYLAEDFLGRYPTVLLPRKRKKPARDTGETQTLKAAE